VLLDFAGPARRRDEDHLLALEAHPTHLIAADPARIGGCVDPGDKPLPVIGVVAAIGAVFPAMECGGRLGDVQPAGCAAGPRRQLTPAFKKLEPGAVLLKENAPLAFRNHPRLARHAAAHRQPLLFPPCAFGRPSGTRTAWFAFCSPRPADLREGTSRRLHAHFPKCRH
jgi:hypothetical protein